jgi:hypothetical protein
MNGPGHYREAEEHLAAARQAEMGSDKERYHLSAAQAHATLAQAAAAALTNGTDGDRWQDAYHS